MTVLSRIYETSLALLTDLYEITMAYAYWKSGMAERESVFHLTFRRAPFGGEYAVACGLGLAAEYLASFQLDSSDLEYLASLTGADGAPLFEREFLRYLGGLRWQGDVDAIPEGRTVFAHEPLIRVRAPLLLAQWVETPLLTMMNFSTLVATKAARLRGEAQGDLVIEFGLRRAQGIDGGLAASRAAFIGGCAATSNVLAGKLFGIPVKGTHAHSWVMAFPDERASFAAYAAALPNNCVFLVDTYDTLQGVRHAIEIGRELRRQGHELLGVRLDSGDLAELSRHARAMLDDAGFSQAAIVASNDLDEYLVRDLKQQGARVNVWGVGTRLATAFDQPALGGVYKLSAVREDGGAWSPRIKLSEQAVKVSNPGVLQVRRFYQDARLIGDILWNEAEPESDLAAGVDSRGQQHRMPPGAQSEALLVPVFRSGRLVADLPELHAAQQTAVRDVAMLPEATRRLRNPTPYPVWLGPRLFDLKNRLMAEAREKNA